MKMFQIQFHTGFVPRNATTVKFAKYVSVVLHMWASCGGFQQACRTRACALNPPVPWVSLPLPGVDPVFGAAHALLMGLSRQMHR